MDEAWTPLAIGGGTPLGTFPGYVRLGRLIKARRA
jgi:hypothetical protein